jgi:DNA-binding response OmpR family regulator
MRSMLLQASIFPQSPISTIPLEMEIPMPRILVVDDEPDLVWAIQYSLRDAGYDVITANDGETGLAAARTHRPDLLILDVMMPQLDGLQVCWRLRRDPALASVPILFLSMRSAIEDRVTCLEEGGDDYLAKPFDLRELKARITALLRRGRGAAPPVEQHTWLLAGALALNVHTCEARVGGRSVQLTPAEFKLMHYLMKHPGKVFPSQHLLQEVWGYSPEAADVSLVRWHIRNLRAKLEPDPDHPMYIRTVSRHGFVLAEHMPPRTTGAIHTQP